LSLSRIVWTAVGLAVIAVAVGACRLEHLGHIEQVGLATKRLLTAR
jgi:hypothetical protein